MAQSLYKKDQNKVSVIIPSFNEAKTLPALVKKLLKAKYDFQQELIIVDDGSTDETAKIFQRLSKNPNIKLIVNSKNHGKGTSVIKGLKIATGDIILIQDADLEYDPKDIPKLIDQFKNKEVKVVYGSRILGKNPTSHWTFSLGGKLLTLITNILFRTNITDEATGYKVFRKDVIGKIKLKSKGFEFCPEITAKIAKKGIKIFEIPISYKPRPLSEKKIKWTDGILAIYYLFKYRFSD